MIEAMQFSDTNLFFSHLYNRTIEILVTPSSNPEAIWLLAPLIITILLMEFYFGRYRKEELGWNTAYGNSLVLIFIAAFLFKYIHENSLWFDSTKIAIMAVLVSFGLVMTIIDYLHLLPEKLAFTISSKLPLNYLAYIAIVLIYTNIQINALTILAFIVIFILFSIFVWFIHVTAPKIRETILPDWVPDPNPSTPEFEEK